MNSTDFYEILNIPKTSSPEQIRKAYKSLVKRWHPDKHPHSTKPEAEARFKAIKQAYEALNGQEYRSMFGVYNNVDDDDGDRGRSNRSDYTSWTSAPTPEPNYQRRHRSEDLLSGYATPRRDFKDAYYGAAATPARPKFSSSNAMRSKPPPVERKLECTLEELCRGCEKEIEFTRDVVARNGMILKKQESETIRVKPGWKKGTKITFEGMGDERPGCLPADVVFYISEKEHPIFKRVGSDLVLKVEVPLVDALTGWTFSFRLLTGEKMSCSFNNEIVGPGYEKVIKGQGMPIPSKGSRGDLIIKCNIIFPAQLSTEQRLGIIDLLST